MGSLHGDRGDLTLPEPAEADASTCIRLLGIEDEGESKVNADAFLHLLLEKSNDANDTVARQVKDQEHHNYELHSSLLHSSLLHSSLLHSSLCLFSRTTVSRQCGCVSP